VFSGEFNFGRNKMKARRNLVRFSTGVFVVLVLSSILSAGEKVQYRLRLKKGRKYYCKSVVEMEIAQILQGNVQQTKQTMGFGYDFDVEDVNTNGDMLVKWTYKLVQFKQESPAGVMEYDSSSKDSHPNAQARPVAALLGESFWVKLTPRGRVRQIKGLEPMYANIAKKLPQGPINQQMLNSLKQQFAQETLKEMIEVGTAIYPNRAVGVGDSWGNKSAVSQGFPMVVQNKWVLKHREGGKATIEVSGAIKPNPKAKPMELGSTKIVYEISGKQNGQIELEESTGRIINSSIKQVLAGEMKMAGSGGEGGIPEMNIMMDIETVTTMQMSERKEKPLKK